MKEICNGLQIPLTQNAKGNDHMENALIVDTLVEIDRLLKSGGLLVK